MNERTLDKNLAEIRWIEEDSYKSECKYQKHERTMDDAHAIFHEVSRTFQEDRDIWQEGVMKHHSEALTDEMLHTQRQFWDQHNDLHENLAEEKKGFLKKLEDLQAEKKHLLDKESTNED